MAKPPRGNDLISVLRGLARVGSAAVEVRSEEASRTWATSSLRPLVAEGSSKLQDTFKTIQQPQALQKEVSRGMSEALARVSMVTEGIKSYRATTATGATQPLQEEYDPIFDPNVQELSVEDMLLHKALSGLDTAAAGLDPSSDPQITGALSGVQGLADTVAEGTRGTMEELNKRLEQFEPLLDIAKAEERSISEEQLEALDVKVAELKGVALGHQFQPEEKSPAKTEARIETVASPVPEQETKPLLHDTQEPQQLSIEEMMMLQAMSGYTDQKAPQPMPQVMSQVQGLTDAVAENVQEANKEISTKLEQFEPLLSVSKGAEQEITEEHLQALDEKVSELQDIAFGHDLKGHKEAAETEVSRGTKGGDAALLSAALMPEAVSSASVHGASGASSISFDAVPQELSIEEMMMQEAHSGISDLPKLEVVDGDQFADVLSTVQEAAGTISGGVTEVKDEVSRKIDQFEPLLNPLRAEEREIMEEHLEALDEKVSELQDVAFGHDLKIFKETQESQLPQSVASAEVQEAVKDYPVLSAKPEQEGISADEGVQGATISVDISPQELSIEEMIMEEAKSGINDLQNIEMSEVGSEKLVDAMSCVQEATAEGKDEATQRMEQFEPLLEPGKVEEQEITEEHLNALDEKLSELQDVAFGHDLKIFKEVEHSQPVEEVVVKVVTGKEGKTGEKTEASLSQQNPETSVSEPIATSNLQGNVSLAAGVHMVKSVKDKESSVCADLDNSISQVAKPVNLGETNTSAIHDFDVEVTLEEGKKVVESPGKLNEATVALKDSAVSSGEEQQLTEENITVSTTQTISQQPSAPDSTVKDPAVSIEQPVQQLAEESIIVSTASQSQHDPPQSTVTEDSVEAPVPAPATSDASVQSDAKIELKVKDEVAPEKEQVKVGENPPEELATSTSDAAMDKLRAKVEIKVEEKVEEELTASSSSTDQVDKHEEQPLEKLEVKSNETLSDATVAATAAATAAAAAAAAAAAKVFSTPEEQPAVTPTPAKPKPKLLGKKPLAKQRPKSKLADTAQARKVPQSRLGRLMSFGGLAAGLGIGTVAEVTRRSLGLKQDNSTGSLLDASPFLTEANAKRIVDTLCKVRGAALKLGQMLSIQDSALINPQLQKIFERVRQSADFMPHWQLERAIVNQLGQDWRSQVASFDERPFAAASIGQVHLATLHDSRSVAMKIQYPGVAQGIESDINNLISSLKVANVLPEGLFVDSVIEVAKMELAWECDYVREKQCTIRFRQLVAPYSQHYYVPEVIPALCTPEIFTTELIEGVPVDQCVSLDQDTRNHISHLIIQLCLKELFQFGFMQTDPNWSNFFYNAETEQLALLDFGACREYDKGFVDKYINLIYGAAAKDRQKVVKYSEELGFLTGYEAKVMVDAHVDAIMILGEAFQEDRPFCFGDQKTTYRIQHLVPVMLSHRMCAPPEESYSLHRKMSGVFLLCAKLNGTINCYQLFHDVYNQYKFGGTWEDFHAGRL